MAGQNRTPLDYQIPERPPSEREMIAAGIRGCLYGVFGSIAYGWFVGAVLFVPYVAVKPTPTIAPTTGAVVTPAVFTRPMVPALVVIGLLLLPVVLTLLGTLATRRNRLRHTHYIGMLVGVGVVCLGMGICFLNQ